MNKFEIDLITLRRVPKGTPTEQPPQNPSTRQENPKPSSPRSHGLGHLGGSGGSTADTNLQRPPSKPLPANKEYPTSPLPGTLDGFREGAGKPAQDAVSGPNGAPSEPLRAPLTTKASREARDPEATGPREKKLGNESRAIPLKGIPRLSLRPSYLSIIPVQKIHIFPEIVFPQSRPPPITATLISFFFRFGPPDVTSQTHNFFFPRSLKLEISALLSHKAKRICRQGHIHARRQS